MTAHGFSGSSDRERATAAVDLYLERCRQRGEVEARAFLIDDIEKMMQAVRVEEEELSHNGGLGPPK